MLVGLAASAGSPADGEGISPEVRKELAEVRAATAGYHRLDAALDAGYELGYLRGANRIITNCVTSPSGAMGYHYFNKELIDDPSLDVREPEGLVYAPAADGGLKLVSVEYIVPGPLPQAPSLLGEDLTVLVPAVGWYVLHAWVWGHNPDGMFAHWNPEVSCP